MVNKEHAIKEVTEIIDLITQEDLIKSLKQRAKDTKDTTIKRNTEIHKITFYGEEGLLAKETIAEMLLIYLTHKYDYDEWGNKYFVEIASNFIASNVIIPLIIDVTETSTITRQKSDYTYYRYRAI